MNTSVTRLNPLVKSLTPKRFSSLILQSRSNSTSDIPTHTGQKWEADDYRLVRFIDAPKQVNHNWAVNMIAAVPPKVVKERVVWCDGGSGPEGHPRVYINLDKPGDHSCGYCGLRFVKKDHH